MSKDKKITIALSIGLAISLLTIVIVPNILITEKSSFFGNRILWTLLLCIIFWSSIYGFLITSSSDNTYKSKFSSLFSSINIISIPYAMLSFIMMILFAFYDKAETVNKLHITLQIILLAVVSIITIFIIISRLTAAVEYDNGSNLTPAQLKLVVEQLLSENEWLSNKITDELKILCDNIRYKLPRKGSFTKLNSYQELVKNIYSIKDKIGDCNNETKDISDEHDKVYSFIKKSNNNIAVITTEINK